MGEVNAPTQADAESSLHAFLRRSKYPYPPKREDEGVQAYYKRLQSQERETAETKPEEEPLLMDLPTKPVILHDFNVRGVPGGYAIAGQVRSLDAETLEVTSTKQSETVTTQKSELPELLAHFLVFDRFR